MTGPPGAAGTGVDDWHPVSPRLPMLRRAVLGVVGIPMALAIVLFVGIVVAWWLGAVLAVLAVGAGAFGWRWIGRACRSWGYAEREEDLLVRHGIWIRRVSVVPYGRMQFVDVTAGPVDRWAGLATVHMHTAAAASNAVIPGLPAAEAERLRDRLAALGEARAAGV